GCGVGAVLTQIAARRPEADLTGVEREAEMAELARANIGLNGLEDRVRALRADIAEGFAPLGLKSFDWAISNPPFFYDESALRPPSPARRGAWMADDGLGAWAAFLLKAVREGGSIVMIHRADRLADILALLAPKAGSFQIRPVHPF